MSHARFTQSEANQFNISIMPEQNVFKLDVPIENAILMEKF